MTILNRITDLGVVQFTNAEGNQDQGFIYVDTNQVMQFQTNSYGSAKTDEQTCTIITGALPAASGSSSVSALLEIQSSTGALLVSRLTQSEINALAQPVNGLIVYNTTNNQFMFYQNGAWAVYGSGAGNGNVVGPASSASGDIATFSNTTGTVIGDSGANISNGNLSAKGSISGASINTTTLTASGNATVGGTITSNGNVTITNGSLIVNTNATTVNLTGGASPTYSYFMNSGSNFNISQSSFAQNNTMAVAAVNGGHIGAGVFYGGTFVLQSSLKIKKVISKEKGEILKEVKDIFNKIDYSKYEYKDKLEHKEGVFYGVIAEEVEEVLPQCVSSHKNFVPNIMQFGKVQKISDDVYDIFLDNDLKGIETFDELKIVTEKEGIIDEIKVLEFANNRIQIKFEKSLGEKIFVYGTKESCPAVSKDNLFEMGLILIKDLLARVEKIEQNL